MGLVLLLGAGFSKWAADLPVARSLFDFDVQPFGIREARQLERLKRIKSEWDALHSPGEGEQFIADMFASTPADRDLTLWYLQRRLVAPYIWEEWHVGRCRRHVLQVDERRVDERRGVREAREFLARCWPEGIITLNYDLLVEYALGTRRFHYGRPGEVLQGRGPYPVSQWRNPACLTGAIPLAKLHGSISWDEQGRYADGRRGLSGHALIVAPVPEKTPPPELQDVWLAAHRLLERATAFITFGMGFNPYDAAVLQLLRTPGGGKSKRVLMVDLAPKSASAQGVWPLAEIETTAPPPVGNAAIGRWLSRLNGH